MTENAASAAPSRGRSVPDRGKSIGVGKSTMWKLVASGRLRAVRIGHRTVILDEDWERFLKSLPSVR